MQDMAAKKTTLSGKEEIQAVVKYGSYHKEKSKAWKENVGDIENLTYEEAEDSWTCPAGQMLHFRKESKPESVFGQLKNNRGFRRFLLRGMEKVTL